MMFVAFVNKELQSYQNYKAHSTALKPEKKYTIFGKLSHCLPQRVYFKS